MKNYKSTIAKVKNLKTALFLIVVFFICSSCNKQLVEKPGMPLIFIDFNGEIKNTGLLKVNIRGDNNVSFSEGISGSCLDLSVNAKYRKPIVVEKNSANSLTDYPGPTILLWVNTDKNDPYEYFIIGQKTMYEELGIRGWSIGKSAMGSWTWWFSDGINTANYNPTVQRQPINNGGWHQIGFSIDYQHKEARLYYNGINVAVISLQNIDLTTIGTPFFLGNDPMASDPLMDTFNGQIDDVGIWSRPLSPLQVKRLHSDISSSNKNIFEKKPDSITFLTWNIGSGGRQDGRYVGVQRVYDVIKQSGADVVAIQEMYGSGEILADKLGFFYYKRSSGLGVLSRYPLGKTYNVYRPQNIGAVTIEMDENRQIIFCPVWLNALPNTRAYVSSGLALPDSVVAREMETRGTEIRYILWELQTLVKNNSKYPLILAGDFNSGSHLDWTQENKERYFGLVVDFPVSSFMQEAGFIDSYRKFYPDETKHRGITMPINFTEGLQDRSDYIFYIGTKLDLISSKTIDKHKTGFPSDHAAVVSSFKFDY